MSMLVLALFPTRQCLADDTVAPPNVADSDFVTVSLLFDDRAVTPTRPASIGVVFKPTHGWHIYWKNPGDSGTAPSFKWRINGVEVPMDILWPVPQRIPVGHLTNYGFDRETMLLFVPSTQRAMQPGDTISLSAEWLTCKEECIPGYGELQLVIPAEIGKSIQELHARFDEAMSEIPRSAPTSFYTATPANGPLAGSKQLAIDLAPYVDGHQISSAYFFPAIRGQIAHAAAQSLDMRSQRLSLQSDPTLSTLPETLDGTLVLSSNDGRRDAFDIAVTRSALPTPQPTPAANFSLLAALLGGLIGGLLLNVMPCVLPVLSIKLISIVELAHADRRRAVHEALLFTVGILLSMYALAGTIIALRASGTAVGWGFQLQSPTFVGLMILLVFLIGLNLSGVFELGAGLQRAASSVVLPNSSLAPLFEGALAVLLATPCTAPFMGAAVGVALTTDTVPTLLIFTALGIGLALPILAVSCVPAARRFVPRPGNWMVTFRKLLAFSLYGTALWLLWVLSLQRGSSAIFAVLSALLVSAFAAVFWSTYTAPERRRRTRILALCLTLALLGISVRTVVTSLAVSEMPSESHSAYGGLEPVAFSRQRLDELRADGRTIYLDFTAAWCITCQVNKRVVFSSNEVVNEFQKRNVVVMKADWTNPNPEIELALNEFSRKGVPLNVIYAPQFSSPSVLPTLLTPQIVLAALPAQ